PGGPVYLYIGGETSGESRFSNLETGIIQILMQATNGLGVILENRYYGKSYPFNTSTTDELAYLTTEQTIADNAYFAQHATFPGVDCNLTAPGTPWILYGGSLAGAQTAFSVKTYGGEHGVLFGGIASSGTTKALLEYPQWYDPIQKYAPGDCTSSINAIIDKIDYIISKNETEAIQTLKELFGLGALSDIRDFAMTIAFPIGGPMNYPTNTWQELNWNSTYGSDDFWLFCSNVTNLNAPTNITAMDTLLSNYTHGDTWTNLGNYANYVKTYMIPATCPSDAVNTVTCYSTQNATYWSDTANSALRSYLYSTCTESGAYQVAPKRGPSLISRVLQRSYTQQWCTWAFPPGRYNRIPSSPDLRPYNKYGGYSVEAPRLAHVDGDQDVWLDLCYHSNLVKDREGRAAVRYGPDQMLIAGAGHHWDSYGIGDVAAEPQFIRNTHEWEIRMVRRWLREFGTWKAGREDKGEL
ncbi:hypothetical protein LTS18_008367, partial [Coniosporium uncinatum]